MENTKTEINFQALFEEAPGLFLVLKPDAPHFTIMGASNAYLHATLTERKKIMGRGLFEVFPDNPNDQQADGVSNLKKSLLSVLKNKSAHKMAIQKYDIQRPETEGGGFEERHWSPLNSPVLNKNNEVAYIIHRVEDITEFILLYERAIEEINVTHKRLEKKSQLIKSNQERINTILDILIKYTVMDFSRQIPISENSDELDAIAIGLNTLSEELENHIRQLKASEERVQVSQKIFSTVFFKSPVMNAITDAHTGKYIEVNENFVTFCGYTKEEIIGKTSLDLNLIPHPEHRTAIINTIKEKGYSRDILVEMCNKAGETKWVSTSGHAVTINGRDCFLSAIIDITERKKAEEQLQEYKYFFNNNNDLCGIADTNGHFEIINNNFKEILGYSESEFCETPFIELIHPDDIPSTLIEYEKLKSGALVINFINRYRKKDGGYLYLDWNATPNPVTQKLYCVARDITERKKAEEQLQAVNKELESFSYSVSHDLRAPLRAIDGYAGILEEDYGKILKGEGKRILEAVQYNAKKMGNLIDDLLAFSRLGKKELTKINLYMNELVEGAWFELNKSIKHNAKIKIKYLYPAKGDYGLINQVVINLLSNAIKYSAKVKEPLVEVSAEKTADEIIYSIKDNGAGFDMKYAHKLFGVFQRLHTMDEFEGTGVGLAIVQKIMAKHGGKVWAEGEKNKGAVFRFSLPRN